MYNFDFHGAISSLFLFIFKREEMTNNKENTIERDDDVLNGRESEYTAIVIGRDLASYLIALILKQHGYEVAIASRPETPTLTDLYEHLSLKYLFEAAQRLHAIRSLRTKGLEIQSDNMTFKLDWQKLTSDCEQEFLDAKERLERELDEKDIAIYEGTIVVVEDYTVRVISSGIAVKLHVFSIIYFQRWINSDCCSTSSICYYE